MSIENTLKELYLSYIQSLPEKIQALETHLHNNDQVALRDNFHRMKGSGATYGVPEISELSAVMEQLCKREHLDLQKVIPPALNILNDIYGKRKHSPQENSTFKDASKVSPPYILEDDPRFLDLKTF